MSRPLVCDVCGKVTDEIVGKVYYTSLTPGNGKNNASNLYQLHADVGVCCAEKLKKGFHWRKRVSAQEYHTNRRKNRKVKS